MTTKQDIERVLWKACDSFRGKIDSSRYKDYILSMLFVKYLSDVYEETKKKHKEKYNGDERRVARAMSRERFVLDEKSTFFYLYNNRGDAEIGQKINVALAAIENQNSAKLHNVFRAIDFNSTVDFGEPKEKNAILKNLLEDFNELDLSPSQLDNVDIIGDSYEYMIANFASDAGKKGGEFYTPSKVSELVARLVQPKENERIYDGTCGSGGLLLKAYKQAVEEMGSEDTFRGYAPDLGYTFLREAIAANDFQSRGCGISADEIFVSLSQIRRFRLTNGTVGFSGTLNLTLRAKSRKCLLNWILTVDLTGAFRRHPRATTHL